MFILMAYVLVFSVPGVRSGAHEYYDYVNKSEHTTVERCQNAAKIMGYERFHCVPK